MKVNVIDSIYIQFVEVSPSVRASAWSCLILYNTPTMIKLAYSESDRPEKHHTKQLWVHKPE